MGIDEDVFIHPSSVLFSASPPQYIVYHEVVRSSQVWIKGDRTLELWGVDLKLILPSRINPDQPIMDSSSRKISLHFLESSQR